MQAERIAKLLPEVYQRVIVAGTPIATLLEVMAQLQDPVEEVLAQLPDYFDPQRTPDRFVPFLAQWVDLARWLDDTSGGFDSGVGRLRQVVAAAPHLSRLRGTAQGLREAIEWATGVSGVRIDEQVPVPTPPPGAAGASPGASGRAGPASGRLRPFHIVVTLPKEAAVHQMLVQRIVQQEKPAHVTAEIVFEDGPATPQAPQPETDEPADAPTLPVDGPAAPPEPSFPGSEPAPVLTGAPEPDLEAVATPPVPAAPVPPVPGPPTSAETEPSTSVTPTPGPSTSAAPPPPSVAPAPEGAEPAADTVIVRTRRAPDSDPASAPPPPTAAPTPEEPPA